MARVVKPRRQSYADLAQGYAAVDSQLHVTKVALNAMLHEEPIKVAGKRGYTAHIIRPDSACGGIVLVTWKPNGPQSAWSTAYYLEAWVELQVKQTPPRFEGYEDEHALRELAYAVKKAMFDYHEGAKAS